MDDLEALDQRLAAARAAGHRQGGERDVKQSAVRHDGEALEGAVAAGEEVGDGSEDLFRERGAGAAA